MREPPPGHSLPGPRTVTRSDHKTQQLRRRRRPGEPTRTSAHARPQQPEGGTVPSVFHRRCRSATKRREALTCASTRTEPEHVALSERRRTRRAARGALHSHEASRTGASSETGSGFATDKSGAGAWVCLLMGTGLLFGVMEGSRIGSGGCMTVDMLKTRDCRVQLGELEARVPSPRCREDASGADREGTRQADTLLGQLTRRVTRVTELQDAGASVRGQLRPRGPLPCLAGEVSEQRGSGGLPRTRHSAGWPCCFAQDQGVSGCGTFQSGNQNILGKS